MRAAFLTAQDFGWDIEEAEQAWEAHRKKRVITRALIARDLEKRQVPQWPRMIWIWEIDRARDAERQRLLDLTARTRAYNIAAKEKRNLLKAEAAKEAAQAERIRLAAEKESLKVRYHEERSQYAEAVRRQAEREETSKEIYVKMEDAPPADIIEDIRWIYQHLNSILIPDPNDPKNRILNAELLKTAPSQGCVGLAEYYRDEQKDFIAKFLTKLLPRDAGSAQQQAGEGEVPAEDLDPDFGDLESFFEGA